MKKIKDTIYVQWAIIIVLVAICLAMGIYICSTAIALKKAQEAKYGLLNAYIERVEQLEQEDWDLFCEAMIEVESNGREDAIGDGGLAVGVLQIWPIMVADCNEWVGYEKYTLEDRYSRSKSIEMWNIISRRYNPQRDKHWQMKIWNGNAPRSYHDQIMRIYNQKLLK